MSIAPVIGTCWVPGRSAALCSLYFTTTHHDDGQLSEVSEFIRQLEEAYRKFIELNHADESPDGYKTSIRSSMERARRGRGEVVLLEPKTGRGRMDRLQSMRVCLCLLRSQAPTSCARSTWKHYDGPEYGRVSIFLFIEIYTCLRSDADFVQVTSSARKHRAKDVSCKAPFLTPRFRF
ncbi:hypothetical protein AB1N83_003901 [Pleurotus pulmonarius]